MKLLDPGFYYFEDEFNPSKIKRLERAARLCYKSKPTEEKSAEDFIMDKVRLGHQSVIEHEKITIYVVCDRGVSHEIVRHRLAAYSQESTRYCNYSKDKSDNQVTFINIPDFFFDNSDQKEAWYNSCKSSEEGYLALTSAGAKPQIARSALNNSTKTEIAVTYNMREWRHFFMMRTASGAHPQMRQIAIPLLKLFQEKMPCLFGDIEVDEDFAMKVIPTTWMFGAENDEELDDFLDKGLTFEYVEYESGLVSE